MRFLPSGNSTRLNNMRGDPDLGQYLPWSNWTYAPEEKRDYFSYVWEVFFEERERVKELLKTASQEEIPALNARIEKLSERVVFYLYKALRL